MHGERRRDGRRRPREHPVDAQPRPMADLLDLPDRSAKPRQQGITHVLDRGLSVAEVDGLIEVAGDSVDLVKLGWGTALATGNLERKLERYRDARDPGRARRDPDRAGDRAGPARPADRVAARARARRTSRSPTGRSSSRTTQARADRAAGAGVHGPLRGGLQGRHADHGARTGGSSRSSRSSRPAPGR